LGIFRGLSHLGLTPRLGKLRPAGEDEPRPYDSLP